MKNDVHVRVLVNSTYDIFDQSGDLPFEIIIGLVRTSSNEADPRDLRFNASESILDVPHAISHGLLTLSAEDAETGRGSSIDIRNLDKQAVPQSHVVLPSPVNRQGRWTKNITVYKYYVDPRSDLASLFKPGFKYKLRGPEKTNLGGHNHQYIPRDNEREPTPDAPERAIRLISGKANGVAGFRVVSSLPWPPRVLTQMQHYEKVECSDSTFLKFSVTNTGTDPVSVQTDGRQKFLITKGVMGYEALGSEGDLEDPRPRIIDRHAPAPQYNLQVWDDAMNKLVKQKTRPPICGLYDPKKYDPRPKIGSLETLEPEQPLTKIVDVGRLFTRLPDGAYSVKLELRGLWWCPGAIDDFAVEGEERVPAHIFNRKIPPLILECKDTVHFTIEDGQVLPKII